MERLVQQMALWSWRATAMQTMVGVGLLAAFWTSLPPEIPMLYSRPWGQEQLVHPYWLWLMPALGLALGTGVGLGTNRISDRVLRTVLLGSVLVVQIILTVGLVRIVLLVI